jgi:hypothetical protein
MGNRAPGEVLDQAYEKKDEEMRILRGLTAVEWLVVASILGLIACMVFVPLSPSIAEDGPICLSTNSSGQQAWKVPVAKYGQWHEQHRGYRIVSMAPISETESSLVKTNGFLVVIEASRPE